MSLGNNIQSLKQLRSEIKSVFVKLNYIKISGPDPAIIIKKLDNKYKNFIVEYLNKIEKAAQRLEEDNKQNKNDLSDEFDQKEKKNKGFNTHYNKRIDEINERIIQLNTKINIIRSIVDDLQKANSNLFNQTTRFLRKFKH